jgi:hypothetical protein
VETAVKMHHLDKREETQDSHIDNSIVGRGRSRVAVVMRVKLEAKVGSAGVEGGGTIRYFYSLETESREAMKPEGDRAHGRLSLRRHRWHCWGWLCGTCRKEGGRRKGQKGGGGLVGKSGREDG